MFVEIMVYGFITGQFNGLSVLPDNLHFLLVR